MSAEKSWIREQLEFVAKEVETWPDWRKQEADRIAANAVIGESKETTATPQSTVEAPTPHASRKTAMTM